MAAAVAAAGLACSVVDASAQTYTPIAIVPSPDVYSYLQQNPSVQGVFGPKVTGQFTSLTVFGDSYADWGNALRAGSAAPPSGRYSAGLSMADALQFHYGLPTSSVANYATGGAMSGDTNVGNLFGPPVPVLPGTGTEIRTFLAAGGHFGPRDLVDITTAGGNDGVPILFNPAITQAQMNTAAAQTTANILSDVQQLVQVGARNLAILSVGDLSYLPIAAGNQNIHYFQSTLTQMEQASLAPLARSGIRIFFFDLATLTQRVVANPSLYGFTNVTTACTAVPSCVGGSVAAQNQFLSYDGLHFTTAGFALIGRYQTNQIDAPLTVAPQGDVAMSIATGFAGSVFGHLDAYRNVLSTAHAMNAMAADMPAKAIRAARSSVQSQWSVYGDAAYAGGSRDSQQSLSSYNYNSVGGWIGLDYRLWPDLLVGGLFSYAQPNVNLAVQNAHEKIDAYQIGGYASYSRANWFADALIAYGRQAIATDRQGVIDVIRGSTQADTFTVAARGGYLWDLGALRVGPIGGLSYTNAQVAGYTETGDILLTNMVSRQTLESLTGSAGVQFRAPFAAGGAFYNPYLNLTVEHDFLGSARTLITTLVTTPLLPVLTPIDGRTDTYGKVAAGLAAAITDKVSVNLGVVSTFARSDRNDYGVNGGLKVAF
ncbi:autotransporter domain-containing protein [Bradyrhizobium sp. SRS-191]|uniref:autotransporter domain-containing protein n=1 Tax=Bradyrhizobium sp. SRS-191 TaxID=2962606 RepID=UPI00211E6C26|nr:autotransporter domain-containing protein [Bradyrhizobium sp. SRS-191]